MKGLSKERREKRLLQEVSEDKLITSKKYNMIMSGAIFYGIALNALLCVLLGDAITKISIWAILIPYFVFTIIGVIMTIKSSNPLISFIGYNFVVIPVGVTLSAVISEYGGLRLYSDCNGRYDCFKHDVSRFLFKIRCSITYMFDSFYNYSIMWIIISFHNFYMALAFCRIIQLVYRV